MNTATDPRLYGTWGPDPHDRSTVERFGSARQVFRPDGTLAFISATEGKASAIFLAYSVNGDEIVTDQPSSPREERARFAISSDGRLTLGEGQDSSRWIKISAEFPTSPEEAAARKRAAEPLPVGPQTAIWGGTKLKEFRVPGLRAWYPETWTQNYHDDGAPYFVGPGEDSGLIRLGILRIEPKGGRGLFSKKPPGLDEKLQVLLRSERGSVIAQLGKHKAVYMQKAETQFIHHRWTLPDKHLLVVGTYTENRSTSQTPAGRDELETARRILSSLEFQD